MLDEPSNFLDREALGGLAVAIREWAGAVVCTLFIIYVSHILINFHRLLFPIIMSLFPHYVSFILLVKSMGHY